ncbi:hypothetical protein FB451DRAFT_1413178 [Mycena latifolia]|nr:hypothetical protein FB451DRAFT_1413178 [Mycena latifolia]
MTTSGKPTCDNDIDHYVEGICSPLCNVATEMHSSKAPAQLVPTLLRCKADDVQTDVEARHLCQMAVVETLASFRVSTPCGASHAIGHMLGPCGVGHGETSVFLLPAVCKFNARHNMLDAVVRMLGMLLTLAEVGVGRDKFEQLEEHSLLDVCSATNAVPITQKAEVMEILEMVAGASG